MQSYQSEKSKGMIRELFRYGVSNANIAQFLNDCGYSHPSGEKITEDNIRGLCRKMGLKRPPGWNLPNRRPEGGAGYVTLPWLLLFVSTPILAALAWWLLSGAAL